jgi:prepilin-type N-terminal cleavage/methylation domain-containing protein
MLKNPPPSRPHAEWHGFTLIELLVVISIIAVLAGLAFPAFNGAMDSARKARAKSDVTQIATAVIAYDTAYGKLPTVSGNSVDTAFLDILTGVDTNADANPRKIVFLELSEWKKGQGGTNASGFCDPWDNASVYQIALDTNYDNLVSAGTNSTNIMKKVALWNIPTGTDAQKNRRYVTSW